MPTEQVTDRVTVFNKSRQAIVLAARLTQEHQEVALRFEEQSGQRVELRALGQACLEVQFLASPEEIGKSYNTVQI
jgi:hypothetical protein